MENNQLEINPKATRELGVRNLKIYSKYFQRCTPYYAIYPEIRIAGKWLQDIGFECGKIARAEIEQNKIIITVV